MAFFWIILGAFMASALWLIYTKVHLSRKMPAVAWILTVVSVLWGGFTLAWAASSIAEGEMRAAGMGLFVFGIALIVLIVITKGMITGKKSGSDFKAKADA